MRGIRNFIGVVVLAAAAAIPWIFRDDIGQPGDRAGSSRINGPAGAAGSSRFPGSRVIASVRSWFGSGDSAWVGLSGANRSPSPTASSGKLATSERSRKAAERVTPLLEPELEKLGLKMGDPVFIRIFKEEKELEVFLRGENDTEFTLFKTYQICKHSGKLGPKQKEGDRQAPEGFYFVTPDRMNPNSRFHLSFDLGYPNAYDQFHGRTGSYLMVHGSCVSIGCFAMTDPLIEEIYTLAAAALSGGQKFFRVHSFPFRMTDERMNREAARKAKWIDFWANLKEGYDYFEMMNQPPNVTVAEGKYVFGS